MQQQRNEHACNMRRGMFFVLTFPTPGLRGACGDFVLILAYYYTSIILASNNPKSKVASVASSLITQYISVVYSTAIYDI